MMHEALGCSVRAAAVKLTRRPRFWLSLLPIVTLAHICRSDSFAEIIPQSLCTRYGLYFGAKMASTVRVLLWTLVSSDHFCSRTFY